MSLSIISSCYLLCVLPDFDSHIHMHTNAYILIQLSFHLYMHTRMHA